MPGRLLLVATLGLSGCASIPPEDREPGDRFEAANRSVDRFNDRLDRAVLKPVSTGYVKHVPQPARTGVSNFYDNLLYLDTVLNAFLQGKIKQGASDLARFGINSTIGLLGIFDVATPIGLQRHDEDFGQTLAVWGAGKGEYVVYPLLGPSGVRDTGGVVVSLLTNPILYAAAPVAIPLGALNIVDLRARKEGFVRFRDEAALDPYIFTRESYLQNRRFEIYDGNPPRIKFDDPEPDPPAAPGTPEMAPHAPTRVP
jgi:phospholipid-binding lipoprotein MlaA